MKHAILITINGTTIEAHAETNNAPEGRTVTAITYAHKLRHDAERVISEQGLTLSDILEVTRWYLVTENPTSERRSFSCGVIDVTYTTVDPEYLKADLTGKLYRVKVVDITGLSYQAETGAVNSWQALDIMRAAVPCAIRSSVVEPLH